MRITKELTQNWLFSKTCKAAPAALPAEGGWERVTLPHTWNAVDGQSGEPFERGAYWYVTTFEAPSQPLPGGSVYIEVGAAGLVGEIWVNGVFAARHVGGYSAFRADVTSLVHEGENTLAILSDNTYQDTVYPQRADFIFYGGLYRYVRVISAPASRFSLDDLGASGVYVDTACVSGGARVSVRALVTNPPKNAAVRLELLDDTGALVSESWAFAADTTRLSAFIPHARLWNGTEDPALYRARLSLVSYNEVLDETAVTFGVRDFAVDPEKGFILNGREMPVRGVCRHQERLYEGNALTPDEHEEDARLIAEMGANGVRLAHYQQAQEMYDACDRLGLIVWAEIPYFAQSWNDEAHAAAVNEIREMVAQSYNHPSICFWGLSNEVLMGGNDNPKLLGCHRDLNEAVKELDAKRLTVIAHEYGADWGHALHDISDAEGWNHYFGWYRGVLEDLGKWADDYHAQYPSRRIAISEYGCDSVISYHSDDPVKMDYSEEYQVLLHESACEAFASRPWIWGTFVWNMFDFGSYFRREGGTRGRNNKGLMTLDRRIKKDAYFVYKAWFSKEPFVHIDGRRYFLRPGSATTVKVHTNGAEVSLYADGVLVGTREGAHTFVFENVPLSASGTVLTAVSGGCEDTVTLFAAPEKPEAFTFPGFTRAVNAKNWFEGVEDITGSLETVPGFYSIHDPASEIFACEAAKNVIMDAVIAVSERSIPEAMVFDGDLSLPTAEFLQTGFRASLLHGKEDVAIRRIHAALTKIPKE